MLTTSWHDVFSPILALGINCLAQVLAVRFLQTKHFWRSVLIGFFCGGMALAVIVLASIRSADFSTDSIMGALLVDAPTYLALSYGYFTFVNLGQSSIRIRLFLEIREAPEGVRLDEIVQRYDERALMKMRLDRLLEGGDLIEKGDCYCLGRRRFVMVASVIFFLKRFLLGKESEFDSIS